MFLSSWYDLVRLIVVGTVAYAALVLFLRLSGKRTLTKLNAFDLVVSVALGSTLATVLLSKSVSLVEGMTAFALLIALQFAITWLSVRWQGFQKLIKAEPTLLLHNGRFLDGALKTQRVTREEVLAVMRASGQGEVDAAAAVILETDGSLSVIPGRLKTASSLEGVEGKVA